MKFTRMKSVLTACMLAAALLFTACGSDSNKCSKDTQCDEGFYCGAKDKCVAFGENDYQIAFSAPADGEEMTSQNIEVTVALSEVSEKLHDGMAAVLVVKNNDASETLEGKFVGNTAAFDLKLGSGTTTLTAFLAQNPSVTAEISVKYTGTVQGDTDGDTGDTDTGDTDGDTGDTDTGDTASDTGDTDSGDTDEPDMEKPVVEITSNPESLTSATGASFEFSADKEAAFQCRIDIEDYEDCTSPKVYPDGTFADGDHKFYVKATSLAGVVSDEVQFKWSVDATAPVVIISSHPQAVTAVKTASFTFEADDNDAVFRCRLDSADWEECTSPKSYSDLTAGEHTFSVKAVDALGNESEPENFTWKVDDTIAVIDILAPWNTDKAGNGENDSCKANNYSAAVKDNTIYVGTAQDSIQGEGYGVCFKVGIANTAAGAKIDFFRQNGNEWTHISGTNLSAGDIENGYYMFGGLSLVNGENTIKVVVGGKTAESADAEFVQKIVVATTSPSISWSFPSNNKIFSAATFTAGIFATFSVTNSIPGLVVELYDGTSIADSTLTEKFGSESVSFMTIPYDSCLPRQFYAVLYDTLNNKILYTDNTDSEASITKRNITFDINPAEIGEILIEGKNGEEIGSTVGIAQNPIDIFADVSDTANTTGDTAKTVRLYTNNGSGAPNQLLAELTNVDDTALFEDITLTEAKHTLKIEVTDCTGNISSKTLDPITVSLTEPKLAVISPKGSGDDSRWLVLNDVPNLEGASISGATLNGVKMKIVSDKILVDAKAQHKFNSETFDIESDQILITDDGMGVVIELPPLATGRHQIIVTVKDFAGNIGKIGGGSEEYIEVDVTAPKLTGLVFDDANYPVKMTFIASNVAPETTFKLTATYGEIVKNWSGTITADGEFNMNLNVPTGEWTASITLTDDHGNTYSDAGAFTVTADVPNITLMKASNSTVIDANGDTRPVWFTPGELTDCAESACKAQIWVFAPEGTDIYYTANNEAEQELIIGANGYETIMIPVSLVATSVLNVVSGLYNETFYFKATDLTPTFKLTNPAICPKSVEYCNRIDTPDQPHTSEIELAELGFGIDDDLTKGDRFLNFKEGSAIKFTISDSVTGGIVEIENAPSASAFTKAPLIKTAGENTYTATFSSLTLKDMDTTGQTDNDLIFVLRTESGIVQRYLVSVHFDLDMPETVAMTSASADKKFAEITVGWQPLAVKPYAYDVRYQSYNEGESCTILEEGAFTSATVPLTEFAGNIPEPSDSAMSYRFFVDKVSNSAGTVTADIHKNGKSYCAAVAAVGAVRSYNGQIMALNHGEITADSVKDLGAVRMNWSNIYPASTGYHNFMLRTIGDINADGSEDYVIADRYKTDSEVDNERNGFIDIYSGKDHTLIKSFRGTLGGNERVGQGVSSKADFNGDGFNDFAYTDQVGHVYIYYGSETGIDFSQTPVTFTAKDASNQANRELAVGDYNGDGCDDILISAPSKKVGDYANAGEVYVYYGRGESCASSAEFDGVVPDLTFQGSAANARLGNSGIIPVGDLDGDLKTDFAFGTNNSIFVVKGGSADGKLTTADFKSLSNPGYYMGSGDFNGDGYSDLIYSTQQEVRIYYGSSTGIGSTPDLVISDFSAVYDNMGTVPANSYYAIGIPVEAKDYNGDGIDDLVIGSTTGLLIYYSDENIGHLKSQPTVFDDHINTTAINFKIIPINNGVIYCDTLKAAGNCERLNFVGGE